MSLRRLFVWPVIHWLGALALLLCFAMAVRGASGNSTTTTVQGVLIDKACSFKAETRIVSDPTPHLEGGMVWAYTHTRECLLMPSCQRSGYGIVAYDDNKFLTFDTMGNQKALALIKGATKQEDFRIEVTGQIDGDKMKVTSLKLLP